MNPILSRRALLLSATTLALPEAFAVSPHGPSFPVGKGGFPYNEPNETAFAGITLPVHTYRPASVDPKKTDRILFVMHGTLRNGAQYRDQWVTHAEEYQALLLVPEFNSHDFPSGLYNRGNVRGRNDETVVPPTQWTFPIIERIFSYVTSALHNPVDGYYIYGHSAGGQFVHRLVEFLPTARIKRAVAANAGYYTLPDNTEDPYPLSLTGTPLESRTTRQAMFERDMVILLGEADTDPNDPDLYHAPDVDKQGLYRFARGENFLKVARTVTERDHLHLKWRIETVPGVGHSNEKMAPTAARVLFAKKR